DNEGALNVMWVVGGGVWQGPVRISPTNHFPLGAHLAVGQQLAHQLDVLAIDHSGALNVMWVVDGGVWQGPVGISSAEHFPPGAPLALERQLANQISVVVIDQSGALNVMWVVDGGVWQGPVGISPAKYFPPGAGVSLALAQSVEPELEGFFPFLWIDSVDQFFLFAGAVDSFGHLNALMVKDAGNWQGPKVVH
ncbi:MAG: hypothetical protein J2P36_13895, partial [Ktedonobacteraceae bacterium]|nr:hypothetical protein [Ktedonobacteraceae bacterium]